MKHGAVVPDIKSARWKFDCGDVADDPIDPPRGLTQALSGHFERRRRQIQHTELPVADRPQVIDQR